MCVRAGERERATTGRSTHLAKTCSKREITGSEGGGERKGNDMFKKGIYRFVRFLLDDWLSGKGQEGKKGRDCCNS